MTWRELLQGIRSAVAGRANGNRETDDERSFREIEVLNCPATKTESLERTLDRAESVLEGQLADLTDTDDKAVRTVRIETVLLGAIASVGQVTPKPVPLNFWLKAGGILLVGSLVAGIFTASSASPDYGPGPGYVKSNFESGDSNEEVYLELLQGYREAISHNSVVMRDSARYFFVTRGLLVGSVLLGTVGTLFAI